MQKVIALNPQLKEEILSLLYKNEFLNAILINIFEKTKPDIGDLWIGERENHVCALLHIKHDGNSYYTTFAYETFSDLDVISSLLKTIEYPKLLLAGPLEDVAYLCKELGSHQAITPNLFYALDAKLFLSHSIHLSTVLRQATLTKFDIHLVKKYTIDYLEAETADEIKAVSNHEKICHKITQGLYIIEYKNHPIGMARFVGKTRNFAEITSVYIHPDYRGNHFAKELIWHMTSLALAENKIPVLATSESNTAARKTYEHLSYVKKADYAFEFISLKNKTIDSDEAL